MQQTLKALQKKLGYDKIRTVGNDKKITIILSLPVNGTNSKNWRKIKWQKKSF